jgi:plasmid stabilization system protein ParE
MNIVYAPRALRDLQSIGAYLIERSPSGANNVLAAIKSTNAGHRGVPVLRYP